MTNVKQSARRSGKDEVVIEEREEEYGLKAYVGIYSVNRNKFATVGAQYVYYCAVGSYPDKYPLGSETNIGKVDCKSEHYYDSPYGGYKEELPFLFDFVEKYGAEKILKKADRISSEYLESVAEELQSSDYITDSEY